LAGVQIRSDVVTPWTDNTKTIQKLFVINVIMSSASIVVMRYVNIIVNYFYSTKIINFIFAVSSWQNLRAVQKMENVSLKDGCARGTVAKVLHEIVS